MAEEREIDKAFLREVDDELRRDQLTDWWQRWGKLLLVLIGVGLLALAGTLWWREEQKKRGGEDAVALSQALDALQVGNDKDAMAKLKTLREGDRVAYRAAAATAEADALVEAGQTDRAAAPSGAIAADTAMPQVYRDLALVRQTAIEFDKMKPADIINRLKPLAVDGGPWFGSAGEMVAIAYLNDNKPELAGPLLAAIAKSNNVPGTLRTRTAQLAGQLGYDALPVTDTDTGTAEKMGNAQ